MHHSHELKIKLLTLGYEIRQIRRIEQKLTKANRAKPSLNLGDKRLSLYNHRLGLSAPARNTLLAYGFLKDRPYLTIENKRYTDPNWAEVQRMATQYGDGDRREIAQRFEQWKQAAGEKSVRVKKPDASPA